jgi:hypothetical protein
MEPLDDEGRRLLERERIRTGDVVDPIDHLPLTVGDAEAGYERKVKTKTKLQGPRSGGVVSPLVDPNLIGTRLPTPTRPHAEVETCSAYCSGMISSSRSSSWC